MECLSTIHHFHHKPVFLKPSLLSPKPFIRIQTVTFRSATQASSVRSSLYRNLDKTAPQSPFSFIRPAAAALTAAAAILAAQFLRPLPSLASTLPQAAQTETRGEETDLTDEEKERILEESLRSNPEDRLALQVLMELKIKQKKLLEAIGLIERLIALEPGEKELLLLRAHLHNYAGDTEASKARFEDIIRDDPLVVEAYHGLVMLVAQAEESGAANGGGIDSVLESIVVAMERCLKEQRKTELRDFKMLVAQIRVMEGEYDYALGIYQELVHEEPKDFRPYLCQGIIYTLMKKKDEADKQFEKYRLLVPKDHPYAQYFDENMATMMALGQMQHKKGEKS